MTWRKYSWLVEDGSFPETTRSWVLLPDTIAAELNAAVENGIPLCDVNGYHYTFLDSTRTLLGGHDSSRQRVRRVVIVEEDVRAAFQPSRCESRSSAAAPTDREGGGVLDARRWSMSSESIKTASSVPSNRSFRYVTASNDSVLPAPRPLPCIKSRALRVLNVNALYEKRGAVSGVEDANLSSRQSLFLSFLERQLVEHDVVCIQELDPRLAHSIPAPHAILLAAPGSYADTTAIVYNTETLRPLGQTIRSYLRDASLPSKPTTKAVVAQQFEMGDVKLTVGSAHVPYTTDERYRPLNLTDLAKFFPSHTPTCRYILCADLSCCGAAVSEVFPDSCWADAIPADALTTRTLHNTMVRTDCVLYSRNTLTLQSCSRVAPGDDASLLSYTSLHEVGNPAAHVPDYFSAHVTYSATFLV